MTHSAEFTLDPRLAADTHFVADAPACRILLMDDRRWPWLILVPRKDGVEELFDLTSSQQATVMSEATEAGQKLQALSNCEKINIAAIGNIVRQLHIHVIARAQGDANWPGPVWGFGTRTLYEENHATALVARLRGLF